MNKALFLTVMMFSNSILAQVCQKWSLPDKAGELNTKVINEASGIALSRIDLDRLYHNNDSGDGAHFYMTDLSGKHTKKITFDTEAPIDIEDLSVGPCGEDSCLYLADIGDNQEERGEVQIWVVKEEKKFSATVKSKKIRLRYPDWAHNAEAFAVHPQSGDLYILTKEFDESERRAKPAKIFRLRSDHLSQSQNFESLVLEAVGELDLPWLHFDFGLFGQIVTSMDISPDGKKALLLTYENAIEIRFDRLESPGNTKDLKSGADFQTIRWSRNTSQQEAITYSSDGRSFFYDTEFNPDAGDKDVPLFKVKCED